MISWWEGDTPHPSTKNVTQCLHPGRFAKTLGGLGAPALSGEKPKLEAPSHRPVSRPRGRCKLDFPDRWSESAVFSF